MMYCGYNLINTDVVVISTSDTHKQLELCVICPTATTVVCPINNYRSYCVHKNSFQAKT